MSGLSKPTVLFVGSAVVGVAGDLTASEGARRRVCLLGHVGYGRQASIHLGTGVFGGGEVRWRVGQVCGR